MTDIEPDAHGTLPAISPAPPDRTRNPYWAYLARLDSPETIRTMQGCLDRLAAILMPVPGIRPLCYGEQVPWWQLRYAHAVILRKHLTANMDRGDWSPSHVNKHLSAFRQVIRECWRLEYLTADERDRISDVPNVNAKREPAGRNIREDEIWQMLAACASRGGLPGTRDAAIIAALQSTGDRRAEVAGMLIENYDHAERSVKVIGKGNHERTCYFHPGAALYIDKWLVMVGKRRGPVFRPVDKWGNIAARHLSPRAIGLIVDQYRKECSLPAMSTHDYRRTFIGDMLDAGVDLATVQQLVGHASPATTARYDRRPGRTRRSAVDKLTLPEPQDFTAGESPEESTGTS